MKLRDLLGTLVTIAAAVVEHWLGETAAMAVLTAVVLVFGGLLWRRVSLLMARPQPHNCTKAYAVEQRLVGYMEIMAPLAPLVNANTPSNTNATFLASLSKLPNQTTANSTAFNSTAFAGLASAVNNLQANLQGNNFEA